MRDLIRVLSQGLRLRGFGIPYGSTAGSGFCVKVFMNVYSRSPRVGNPIASILKSNVKVIPALFDLNPASNFMGFTIGCLAPRDRVFGYGQCFRIEAMVGVVLV